VVLLRLRAREVIMLAKKDYQTALDIQNACNLSGVIRSWNEIIPRIWEDIRADNGGTAAFNSHPINVLFSSKVESLTQSDDFQRFSIACGVAEARSQSIDACGV
jgi:hypothetical protein